VSIYGEDGSRVEFSGEAVIEADEIEPESGDCVLITTKSQATAEVVESLSKIYDRRVPVVCLQNGVSNESVAAARFDRVYAGLVLLSAVQLQPDTVKLARGRTFAVGCYPKGVDETARSICEDLARAGFEAPASAYVMAMKWGKLIANLNNATHTIVGYWLERSMADAEMRNLMAEVCEEGLRVLDAAGIAVEPPEGEPSPIRARKYTAWLRRPPKNENVEDVPEEKRTYASMVQDLLLGRRQHEAEFLNGEIVALGRKLGIATPYNSTLLKLVSRMFEEGIREPLYTPGDLHALIRAKAC
jgi:2-dehydropantoate 2-reductase